MGDTSVILIDILDCPGYTEGLKAELSGQTDKPMQTIIYTHGHPDHRDRRFSGYRGRGDCLCPTKEYVKIIKGCTKKAAAGTKTSAAALPVRIIPSERHPPALLSLSSGSAQDCRQLGQREYVHPTENRWHRFQRSSQWFLPGQR